MILLPNIAIGGSVDVLFADARNRPKLSDFRFGSRNLSGQSSLAVETNRRCVERIYVPSKTMLRCLQAGTQSSHNSHHQRSGQRQLGVSGLQLLGGVGDPLAKRRREYSHMIRFAKQLFPSRLEFDHEASPHRQVGVRRWRDRQPKDRIIGRPQSSR